MKKITLFLFVLLLLLSFGLTVSATDVSANRISETVQKQVPIEFGYVDNTEYYMQHYFSQFSFVDDSSIVVASESTNFNEIGVFHIAKREDVKKCARLLTEYLNEAKIRFQSGVIYDIKEYPKFENAKVTVIDQYVIYTILDKQQGRDALRAVRDLLQ